MTADRKKRMTRLSTMLGDMVAPSVRKRGFVMSRLISEWPAIAGDMAEWSRPSKLALARGGGGTLTLAIASGFGPVALQMRDAIISRVNATFGYQAVSDITFVQTLPPPAITPPSGQASLEQEGTDHAATRASGQERSIWELDAKLEKIKSPEMRAALRRLGMPLKK